MATEFLHISDASFSDPDAFTETYNTSFLLDVKDEAVSVQSAANAQTGKTATANLENLASSGDFTSLTFKAKGWLAFFTDDTATYRVRLVIGGSNYDINFSSYGSSDLTVAVGTTFSVAQINAATVELSQTAFTRNMSNDGGRFQLDFIELEVNYTSDPSILPYNPSTRFQHLLMR